MPGGVEAVSDVGDAPLSIEAVPVGTSVSGAPPVVHLRHSEPSAREELGSEIQPRFRVGGWAFVGLDNERRRLALGPR